MKNLILGILGGALISPALLYLYDGLATGLLNCTTSTPEICAAAESRIAWSTAFLSVGLACCAIAVWRQRRQRH